MHSSTFFSCLGYPLSAIKSWMRRNFSPFLTFFFVALFNENLWQWQRVFLPLPCKFAQITNSLGFCQRQRCRGQEIILFSVSHSCLFLHVYFLFVLFSTSITVFVCVNSPVYSYTSLNYFIIRSYLRNEKTKM